MSKDNSLAYACFTVALPKTMLDRLPGSNKLQSVPTVRRLTVPGPMLPPYSSFMYCECETSKSWFTSESMMCRPRSLWTG